MSLIPPPYLNAVVSIELKRNEKADDCDNSTIATGFLYGKLVGEDKAKERKTYKIFLITNRHVFENRDGKLLEKVFLRFNLTENKGTKCFEIPLIEGGTPKWLAHNNKNVDLAIVPLNATAMSKEKIDFFFFKDDSDLHLTSDFQEKGITTGDGIFLLGFPLGLRGNSRNFSIVKYGIIARVDDELLKEKYFLIDSTAYPGNSGGPVIYKPEIISIEGTKSVNSSGLIGIVSAGVAFQEAAISEQTGRTRVIFEEQTGLVKVVPIDLVEEVINQYSRKKDIPEESKTQVKK